jgi:ADP-ribose pyrophosphatase
MDPEVKVLSSELAVNDYLKVQKARVSVGGHEKPHPLWKIDRGDAAAAVLYNSNSRKLILTRQFRYPCAEKDNPWLIELVAGMIDDGETLEQAIIREIEEEAGYRVNSVDHLFTYFSSPGVLSERVSIFYVETSDAQKVGIGGGKADEGEELELLELTAEEARALLTNDRIRDSKTLIGLQWFLNR